MEIHTHRQVIRLGRVLGLCHSGPHTCPYLSPCMSPTCPLHVPYMSLACLPLSPARPRVPSPSAQVVFTCLSPEHIFPRSVRMSTSPLSSCSVLISVRGKAVLLVRGSGVAPSRDPMDTSAINQSCQLAQPCVCRLAPSQRSVSSITGECHPLNPLGTPMGCIPVRSHYLRVDRENVTHPASVT